ncbi:MAG TPA: DUF58 domain-containing protein [Gammaproteobacteria bacterium]|nr:DUF58 domain-containing protein [Gammaproteobacteria bacterium]
MARRLINTVRARLAGGGRLARAVQRFWTFPRDGTGRGDYPPLVSSAEIEALLRRLQGLGREPGAPWLVHTRQVGEADSAFVGSGLDFEELRPYAAGDDLRDVDWRALARSGRAFVKRYREERQAVLHVVLDRRANMRFGTHCRLKVAQGARAGAVFALAAMLRGAAVGLTSLGPDGRHVRAQSGRGAIMGVLRDLAAPCPPLVARSDASHDLFARQLAEVESLVPAGGRVLLLSDFRGLREDDLGVLARLAARCPVTALHIEDESERHLPALGWADFAAPGGREVRTVDAGSAALRDEFAAAAHQRRQTLRERLEPLGIAFHSCTTCDDVFVQLGASALHG